MITSAMRLSLINRPDSDGPDLTSIGLSKARTYKSGGPLVVAFENGAVAIVQGYKPGLSLADCLPTCILVRDLAGRARNCYGEYPDASE